MTAYVEELNGIQNLKTAVFFSKVWDILNMRVSIESLLDETICGADDSTHMEYYLVSKQLYILHTLFPENPNTTNVSDNRKKGLQCSHTLFTNMKKKTNIRW